MPVIKYIKLSDKYGKVVSGLGEIESDYYGYKTVGAVLNDSYIKENDFPTYARAFDDDDVFPLEYIDNAKDDIEFSEYSFTETNIDDFYNVVRDDVSNIYLEIVVQVLGEFNKDNSDNPLIGIPYTRYGSNGLVIGYAVEPFKDVAIQYRAKAKKGPVRQRSYTVSTDSNIEKQLIGSYWSTDDFMKAVTPLKQSVRKTLDNIFNQEVNK
jgi:hypothetical protein